MMDEFKSIEVSSDKKGEKIIRINLKSEEDATKWLRLYEEETNTKFIVVDPMSAQPKRYIFHKKWACQLSSYNKKEGTKRNLKCPAVIDILIKKLTPDTKKNDTFLKRDEPLQGLIKITEHNHAVNNSEALGYLRILPEVRKIFEDYFNNGHGPGESITMHETKMMLEDDGYVKIANSSINPKSRTVYYLHDLWRTSEFGKVWSANSPLKVLEKKIDDYKAAGVEVNIKTADEESRWCVIVVTPIMKRAHALRESTEIIFIDSTSSCDAEQTTITIALTATKGGGIPLTVLLHNRQDEAAYTMAFQCLKEFYPQCFGGQMAPEIFMTDNCAAERNALKTVWPSSHQFLCHFHVGQQEWRWLTESKNKVPTEDRQGLMSKFQKIMYAMDTESFETAVEEFFKECSHEKFRERIEKFLERKTEWAKLFRIDLLSRGHHTNNYVEAAIRILKEIILCRTKAYNVVALVAFVANVWEDYFIKRLLHYAYQREHRPQQLYNKLCKKLDPELTSKIQRQDDNMFLVPSSQTGEVTKGDPTMEFANPMNTTFKTLPGNMTATTAPNTAYCSLWTIFEHNFVKINVTLTTLVMFVAFANRSRTPLWDHHYEVNSAVGWCSCPAGSDGAFCKHQTAVHEVFGVGFPNFPPIDFQGRYQLGVLALAEKCPPVEFFIGLRESATEEMVQSIKENTAFPVAEDVEQIEEVVVDANSMNEDEAGHNEQQQKEADELFKEVLGELTRVHQLAKEVKGDVHVRNLRKLVGQLRCRSTPSQAIDLIMRMNAAASTNTRKGRRIQVQPTGIARRKEGKSRGSKRIPAGRPPRGEPPSKRPKHTLSLSVKQNKSHAKGHGH